MTCNGVFCIVTLLVARVSFFPNEDLLAFQSKYRPSDSTSHPVIEVVALFCTESTPHFWLWLKIENAFLVHCEKS